MSIDITQVRKVATLARLRLKDGEDAVYEAKLNPIMKWIEGLSAVNTDGVEPLSSVTDITLPLRDDIVNDGNIQAEVLANAPEAVSGFFAVPKIVE